MENNKYINKVIESLVRTTKIDYENEKIHPQFAFAPIYFHVSRIDSLYNFLHPYFKKYCTNQFGLTDDEIFYVWQEYKTIISDKIRNRE